MKRVASCAATHHVEAASLLHRCFSTTISHQVLALDPVEAKRKVNKLWKNVRTGDRIIVKMEVLTLITTPALVRHSAYPSLSRSQAVEFPVYARHAGRVSLALK